MQKYTILSRLRKAGDAVIDFRDPEIDSILCTTDFRNKFIRRVKGNKRFNYDKDNILIFDWTNSCFGVISPADIKFITPLAQILNNKGKPTELEYGIPQEKD